jgi:ribosomal protein S17E
MPEQSLFGQMGDGLKSMGQGMSGYMGKLFDDPNRMALLQGGLSMMDPNSYYDKQGFGSVFTGLNKGFGAAQGGMQGVLDRRKSLADIQKTKAEARVARTGGSRGEHEKILRDLKNPLLSVEDRKHKLARLHMIEEGATPSIVKEWDIMQSLSASDQVKYRALKRAAVPTVDFGGKVGIRDATDPDNPNAMKFIEKTLEKHQEPTYLQNAEFVKATGKTIGEAQAHAKTTLGVSQQSADYMMKTLDDAASHPGMAGVVGVPNLQGYLPGTDEAGFKTLYDQLKGKTFLKAYETLKGGGQITEVEGAKGEAALARLGTAQSEEEFLVALQDFKDVVRDLLEEQTRQSKGEFGGYITRAKRAKDAKAKAGKSNKFTPEEDAELKALELKFGGK